MVGLKETRFVNFSGRKCCRLCRKVVLSPHLLRPLLASLSVNYFFDHNHTCVLLNISALRVQFVIQAFDEFKRPECTRLHLRELQFQKFSRGSMPPDPLDCRTVGSPVLRGYRAPIDTTISLSPPPPSQNPQSAPV